MDIEKIYDLVAMRIIMETIPECYAVLGIVHHMWPPIPGRIKDYIAMPKLNSYRSLHTTVVGPREKNLEIQIRTAKMHEENENGLAGHWLYEQNRSQGKSQKLPKNLEKEIGLVGQLRNWLDKYRGRDSSPEEFLGDAKIKFFQDRIFVLTPKGDVIDLPLNGTLIDFAYHIHTEIGNAATSAKVNGKIVPLDTKLSSGDLVEILTQKNKKPESKWLEFAKTSLAKDHIRAELRKKNKNLLKRLRGPYKK
ncbi:MAG: bifunctional (p)ppGpp synthetase/guanosine-3',5'-bis(diphosphate) 3'-pyrophosphohydrolase [Candidatus Liptonbacteria bacterium]|nr:bifunctional (p)ppGpp synthetase/guanosine-3',5'-bis(diphosphate) 3'-pyrophosphohydrolase [Candidatus Liptonbacteria bacterium]